MTANDLLMATLAGALIVLWGAVYALLFALGRLQDNRLLGWLGYVAYALLVGGAIMMSVALSLTGFWIVVIGVALIGYLLLPQVIWHLCVGTHAAEENNNG